MSTPKSRTVPHIMKVPKVLGLWKVPTARGALAPTAMTKLAGRKNCSVVIWTMAMVDPRTRATAIEMSTRLMARRESIMTLGAVQEDDETQRSHQADRTIGESPAV